jgi:uncharacterized membrane protein YqaE (UPF0057 family)
MKKNYLLLIALLIVFASSCTITKRRYNSGYHIEWKHAATKVEKINQDNELAKVETNSIDANKAEETSASASLESNIAPANTTVSNPISEAPKSLTQKSVAKKSTTRSSNVSPATFETPVQSKTSTEAFVPVTDHVDAAESHTSNDVDFVVLVILAIFLPPLAVYLHQGSLNDMFWISVLLTLLLILPGSVFALLLIFDII